MREQLLEFVRCPACGAQRSFELEVSARDEREVREGSLRCRTCDHLARIEDGIVDLMHEPPEFVERESAGLERFADLMRRDGWDRDRILALPYEENLGYWHAQGLAMRQLLRTVPFQPGERMLDVGSNTCWASTIFAVLGLEVIALDISTHEMQGLRTADWWFEARNVFYERVLSVMFDAALADDSLDYVFCCEVLHHNHRSNLFRTLKELHRILKPGGKLLVVNEPLRSVMQPKLRPGKEVAEYEGHEHAFVRRTYLRAARRAGFEIELLCPWLHGICREESWRLTPGTRARLGFRLAVANAIRHSERGKRLFQFYKAYLPGDTSLYMIGTKPG